MNIIGTIKQWKLKHFTVIVDAIVDTDLDISFDETGEIAEKLESGELVSFIARARVLLDGNEIASEYLGSCIYSTVEEFNDHIACAQENKRLANEGHTGVVGSYFSDIVHAVIKEARNHINGVKQIHIRASK